MENTAANPSDSNDYSLLHLLHEEETDGEVTEYYVCYECFDLVEKNGGSPEAHNCVSTSVSVGTGEE